MRKKLVCFFVIFSIILSSLYVGEVNVKGSATEEYKKVLDLSEYKGTRFIVVLKEDNKDFLKKIIPNGQIEKISECIYVISMKNNQEVVDVVKILWHNGNIDYIQPDYEYKYMESDIENLIDSNGSKALYQWAYNNDGSIKVYDDYNRKYISGKAGIDINILPAWDYIKDKTSKEVIVAVIDTGIDYTHSSFGSNIWVNTGEIEGDNIDNDENGYIDDVNGWNFYNKNSTIYSHEKTFLSYYDDHGTHCSGTIAADSKIDSRIAGICGDSNIKIMCLKALGGAKSTERFWGSTSTVARAVMYAEENGASICNLSLGGTVEDKVLKTIMKKSNMLFVCAAGNDGQNTDNKPIYPAATNLDNIISVANLNVDGKLNFYSNYGKKSVDIGAPGTGIISLGVNNRYVTLTGTSMATPMVTGTAALIYSYCEDITPARAKKIILNSSKQMSTLKNKIVSGGMLDVYAALTRDVEEPEILSDIAYINNDAVVCIKAKDIGDSGLNIIKWEYGRKAGEYFQSGAKGNNLDDNFEFITQKSGYYTIYACDNSGNEKTLLVNVVIGSKPVIDISIKNIKDSNFKKMEIKITDYDKNLKYVRYEQGIKTRDYFKEGKAGKILKLKGDRAVINVHKTGEYTIYAIDDAGNETILSKKVTILTPSKLKLDKTALVLNKGKTYNLKAVVSPTDVYTKITYESSDKKVASVTNKGKITAIKKGKAIITVKISNNKIAKCTVTVK